MQEQHDEMNKERKEKRQVNNEKLKYHMNHWQAHENRGRRPE